MKQSEIDALKEIARVQYAYYLNNLLSLKQIENYKVNDVTTEWEALSLLQKIIWSLAKYTLIAHFMRNWYKRHITSLYKATYKTHIDAVNAVNSFEDSHRKYWLSHKPKENITVDVSIKPTLPIEYVKVDAILKNKDSK